MIIKIIIVTLITAMLSVSALALDVSLQEHSSGDHILLKNAQFSTDTLPSSSHSPSSISSIESPSNETEDYYIVQFKGSILEEWKRDVSRTGATLFSYVPNNAFIIRMNTSVKAEVETIDSVQWIGYYDTSYRINPGLSLISEKSSQVDVVVILFDENESDRILNEISNLGGEIVDDSGDHIRIIIANTKVSAIASLNGVSWIEQYSQPVLLNDIAANVTNVSYVRNTHGLTGSGQIVAVADSGLDSGFNNASMHDDFEGRIVSIHSWWDSYNDSGGEDNHGHGTHVAGSVLGNGSLSSGLYAGMAPKAQLVFQSMQYDGPGPFTNGGLYFPVNLTLVFQQAYDDGARIHSDSWGSDSSADYGNYTSQSQYVDDFMWKNPDFLILFAAGNEGGSSGTCTPPGTAKNALTVGASENYRPALGPIADNINDIASFSSKGPTDDGRIKPDIVAPGTYIISTRSSMPSASYSLGVVNAYYANNSGTSMATPLTAGTAALVRQYYVDNESIYPTAALLKATLINGAANTTQSTNSQGWGRMDVEKSLFPTSPQKVQFHDNISLNVADSWNVSYHLNNSSHPLKVTLVWTDKPSATFVGKNLVNDLDMVVTGPDGTYLGNGGDDTNNVEQVELSSPSTGWYTVTVNGTNVPNGSQPFAIVLSGPFSNDEIAPLSVTDLATSDRGTTWINWTWSNPIDPDFNHTMLYLDNMFKTNVSNTTNFYNVTGLTANTTYGFSTKTVDLTGNINLSWTNDTANTIVAPDEIAPFSISSLSEYTTGPTWINWTWTNPLDSDFSHTMIYMDGVFKANVTGTAYNATGFIDNTGHIISTHTVDNVGNINLTWINDSASTMNTLPPASVTNLSEFARGPTWIAWTWTNPLDDDFNHTTIYVNNGFIANVSKDTTFYNVTGLTTNTIYEFSTKTVDIVGNINSSWTKDTATTKNPPNANFTADKREGKMPLVVQFTDTSTVAETWAWNFGDGNWSFVKNPIHTYSISGRYEVSLAVSNDGYSDIAIKTNFINVIAPIPPVADFTSNVTSGTEPLSVKFEDNSSNAKDIEWDFGDGNTSIEIGPVHTYTIPGTYNVSLNVSNDDGTDYILIENYITVIALSKPIASFVATPMTGSYPLPVSFTDRSINATKWFWNFGDGNTSADRHPSHTYLAAGTYSVSLNVSNAKYDNFTSISNFITVSTPTTDTTSSSSSGGGGGGSSVTSESYENIIEKAVTSMHIIKDIEKSFTFTNEMIDITYINVTADLNVGNVKAIVESLNTTSSLVSKPPEGRVYKNTNIWLGDFGFEKRVTDSSIGFRVEKTWLKENSVPEFSVKMSVFKNKKWDILPTEKRGEDETYVYYEATPSGEIFSPFAIIEPVQKGTDITDTQASSLTEGNVASDASKASPSLEVSDDIEGTLSGSSVRFLLFAIPLLILISLSYVAIKRGYHIETRAKVSALIEEMKAENINDVGNGRGRSPIANRSATETLIPKVEITRSDVSAKIKKLEESGILSNVDKKDRK
ncbi:S8 family serine peptidase [Methanococcoides alaskense]|uniref:PGF-pre-PGF domain-containing protein n=1 Tax=Methanococcoides alaskense TaxID=325778 RepID=A0AA90ZDB0_9EURY|nr:S8 family serine peptidase [Methanococcoides alaskense]MDA0524479.1 S8 family serine peptidase [Methanococcoides alaskense]MDR6223298.1 PGF-pre-PGF domain-containing protein [Methanococcoides alaskense]